MQFKTVEINGTLVFQTLIQFAFMDDEEPDDLNEYVAEELHKAILKLNVTDVLPKILGQITLEDYELPNETSQG